MTFGYLVYLVFRSWPVKDRPCLLCLLWCLWQIRSRLAVLWRHRPCTVWSSQSDNGRYALDWLYSEGIVRVLCGCHSQTKVSLVMSVADTLSTGCTLKASSVYCVVVTVRLHVHSSCMSTIQQCVMSHCSQLPDSHRTSTSTPFRYVAPSRHCITSA